MIEAIEPLTDVSLWARRQGLEIVLIVTGPRCSAASRPGRVPASPSAVDRPQLAAPDTDAITVTRRPGLLSPPSGTLIT